MDSTFHHSLKRMVPLSLQRGKRGACFPFVQLFSSCPVYIYQNTFHFTPAICKDCTDPRIQPGFLLTCEALQGFTLTQKWRHHFCRQRTKFAAFPLSLQNGKRAAIFPFVQLFPFYRKTFHILPLTSCLPPAFSTPTADKACGFYPFSSFQRGKRVACFC